MGWTLLAYAVVLGLLAESYRQLRSLHALRALAATHLGAAPAHVEGSREQVADLNEVTIELRAGLAHAGVVQKGCARAALGVGALAAIVQSAALLAPVQRSQQLPGWGLPLISFVGGCVGAAGCAYIGRVAEAAARRLRADWSTLIRRSSRDVPT